MNERMRIAPRLAAAGLSMLLLPMSASWAQKDDAPADPAASQHADGCPCMAKKSQALAGQPRKEARKDEPRDRDRDNDRDEADELADRIGKDLEPLGDAVRRSLARALGEVQGALKKDQMTADDLKKALERSRDEMEKSLREGGAIEKGLREAAERARKDWAEAMDRNLDDAARIPDEMRKRMNEDYERHRKEAQSQAEKHRKSMEQIRKEMENRQSEMRREMERRREALRARRAERQDARSRPEDRPESNRESLDAARLEIRELRDQLRAANERIEKLQRRPAPAHPEPSDDRIRDLERKVDRLLDEFRNLKGREESR